MQHSEWICVYKLVWLFGGGVLNSFPYMSPLYIFVEEVDHAAGYSAGRISVVEVFLNSGFSWPSRPVIEEPHLSIAILLDFHTNVSNLMKIT